MIAISTHPLSWSGGGSYLSVPGPFYQNLIQFGPIRGLLDAVNMSTLNVISQGEYNKGGVNER